MSNTELLVIDDEQEMLVNYERILSRGGYQVETLLSAEEALTRLLPPSFYVFQQVGILAPGLWSTPLAHRRDSKIGRPKSVPSDLCRQKIN